MYDLKHYNNMNTCKSITEMKTQSKHYLVSLKPFLCCFPMPHVSLSSPQKYLFPDFVVISLLHFLKGIVLPQIMSEEIGFG